MSLISNTALLAQILIFLPLLAAGIAGFGRHILGDRGAQAVTTLSLLVAAVCASCIFYDVCFLGHSQTLVLLEWIHSGRMQIDWSIRLDALSAVMFVVVTYVSSLVHIYSIGYMAEDKAIPRFMAYLSLFTFMMLALVSADNFIQLFFGWEGVGLASYLLIGFWYDRKSANAASIKAFVVNRVGDFGFMLGILTIFLLCGSVQFDTVFAQVPELTNRIVTAFGYNFDALTLACLLLFVGAVGKSAQLGLHTWLPDAMEGPTPVSALIHAATMVTAGVFLLVRISPLLNAAPVAGEVITIVGALTALVGASIGLVQFDIKKVVAYSTMSQLGYMVFAAGTAAYGAAMFHLFTHAFFKALLFLGAGSVIHAMHHEQDMRRMGGLWNKIPFTYIMMWIGSLALMGIPFFAGYYSKDTILEAAFAKGTFYGTFAFAMGLAAAFLTALYSAKLIFMTFHGQPHTDENHNHAAHAVQHGDVHGERIVSYELNDDPAVHQAGHDQHLDDHGHDHYHAPHESPFVMLLPLFVLAIGALFAGYLFHEFFVGHARHEFWRNAIPAIDHDVLDAAHHVPFWVPLLPLVMAITGFLTGMYAYWVNPAFPSRAVQHCKTLYVILVNKYFFDYVYDRVFARGSVRAGAIIWKDLEEGAINAIGPRGSAAASLGIGRMLSWLQSGAVYQYAFIMLIGLVGFLGWFVWGR